MVADTELVLLIGQLIRPQGSIPVEDEVGAIEQNQHQNAFHQLNPGLRI